MQSIENSNEIQERIARLYDQTPLIGWKIRRDAVDALARDGSLEAVDALAEALTRSDDVRVQKMAVKTLLKLAAENRIEAQEAFCRLVIEHDHPLAREIVLAAQYAPRDPVQRVLFYFLMEQWDEYEAFDVDQSLLKALYPVTDTKMRKRLVTCARRSGRLEWVGIVSAGRKRKRASEMTDQEWEAALSVIIQQGAWHDLWRLAHVAPVRWSVRFLLWLRDVRWQSEQTEEQEAFTAFVRLAEECNKGKSDLFLYGLVYCRKKLGRYTGGITCLAISSDSKTLASGNEDGTVQLWRLPEGAALRTLEGHTGYIMDVAISPDNKVLASAGLDNTVWLWRLPEGDVLKTLEGHNEAVECLAFSPDGQVLASGGGKERSVRLWRLPDGEVLKELEGYNSEVTCLAFSPDGQMLATGYNDGVLQLWHLLDGMLRKTLKGHDTEVSCLAFSPDGQTLASGSGASLRSDMFYRDPKIQLWRLPEGETLKILDGHTGTVEGVGFSSNGRLLASVGGWDDNTLRLWRLPDGTALQTLKDHHCAGTCLAFSPDGQILASGSADGSVCLWALGLVDLQRLNIGQTEIKELQLLQERLKEGNMTDAEQTWLKFILALICWNRRHDIEMEEAPHQIQVDDFDIELSK